MKLQYSAFALMMSSSAVLAEAPNVVTDIAPIHSLVSMVMGQTGEPDMLIEPGTSAHDLVLKPSQAQMLSDANVVIWVGPEMNPAAGNHIETLSPNALHIELMEVEGTHILPFRENAIFGGHEEHAEHDHDDHDHGHDDHADHDDHKDEHADHDHDDHAEHAHEDDHAEHDHKEEHDDGHDHGDEHDHAHEGEEHHDDHDDHAHDDHKEDGHEEAGHHDHHHGENDPHVWLSPDNAIFWLGVIAEELGKVDQDNRDTYFYNATKAIEEIKAAETRAKAILDPVKDAPLAAYHDAYQYYEEAFDLNVLGAITDSDDVAPGAKRIGTLRDEFSEVQPKCFVMEPGANARLILSVGWAELLNNDSGKEPIARLDPQGRYLELGAGLYPALIEDTAQRIADCVAE